MDLVDRVLAKVQGWLEAAVVLLPNFLVALVVAGIGLFLAKWVERGVSRVFFKVTGNRPISDLLAGVARVATIVVGFFAALALLGLDKTVTSLLAGVGVIGLALGFAFQDIAANFMSGFLMALRRPFDIGDQVEIGSQEGRIIKIAMRATEIETLDGLSILVPNKDVFQNAIVNYTKTKTRRLDIAVGTAYCDDLENVRSVIVEAVAHTPSRDSSREVEVFFGEFADSSINSTVRIWLTESKERDFLHAKSEAMIAIKKAFDAARITIPFPIRTLDFGAKVVGGERIDEMRIRLADAAASVD